MIKIGRTKECAQAFANYDGPCMPGRVTCRQNTSREVITGVGCSMAGISGFRLRC